MEKKFDGLRTDVLMVSSAKSREQDLLEEVLDRQAELAARLEREREVETETDSGVELEYEVEGGPQLLGGADGRGADLLRAASEELSSVMNEVVTAMQLARAATESSVEVQRENTDRLRLLQTALTRQLKTLAVSVEESERRSDARVAGLSRQVEALAKRLPDTDAPRANGRAKPKPKPKSRVSAPTGEAKTDASPRNVAAKAGRSAPARKTTARKTTARKTATTRRPSSH
jgi:hypothetical protein